MVEGSRGAEARKVDALNLGFELALLTALATVASAATSIPVHTCDDPCLHAARASRKECASSASSDFTDAIDDCAERAQECVAACRFERQQCRDATYLGAEIAACLVDLEAAKGRCRDRLPPGSRVRALCIDGAEAASEWPPRASVKGRSADIDVSVRDALDLATSGNAFTAAGYLSIGYDRWTVFADAFEGYAEESVNETIPTRIHWTEIERGIR